MKAVKTIIDGAMLILLLMQMALPVTGQKLHEWLGVLMFCSFIVHNILNLPFYKSLFKGKYSASRALLLVINIALSADIICLMISGIKISGYVFDFLNVSGGMMTARKMHLCSSYWGLVIMSAHLGMNWSMVFHVRKLKNSEANALRIITVIVSALGIYSFIQQNILQYLFLRTHFVCFDYDMNKALFFGEYISVITLFAAAFYYISRLLKGRKNNEKNS